MKKIVSIAVVLFLTLAGITVVGFNATKNEDLFTISESFLLSELYLVDKGDFLFVDFEDSTSFTSEIGYPEIPVFTKRYVLPFGAQITSMDVLFSNEQEIIISKDIFPTEVPEPLSEELSTESQTVTEFYKKLPVFPEKSYEYNLGTGLDDEGNRVTFLSVICYPVRYNPSKDTIYYSDELEISFEYEEGINSITFGDEYDMVIITANKYLNAAQSLADHKNSYGLSTFIKTTEEIYSEYNKYDGAEEIKYFIKDAIEDLGIEFVLLLGDYEDVPIRTTYIYQFWEGNWYNMTLITDLYYADIYDEHGEFSSWDSNGNGKYGEVYQGYPVVGDDFDLYPDVRVGRIACRNRFDAKIVVSKIINYETGAYGKAWSNRALLMGGDTFPGHGNYEGEFVTGLISEEIPEYEQIILWTSIGNYNPFNINLYITSGVGVATYSGHGYQFGFGTSPPNGEERIEYYTPHTLGMLNVNKYPIFFFDACSTAELDYRRYGIRIPTFAWYIIKKPIGGAIATIGATRIAYTYVNHAGVHGGAGYLNLHFFKAFEDGKSVAEVFNSAQNDYITYVSWLKYLTVKEFILLGDPSLRIGGYSTSQGSSIHITENNNLNLEAKSFNGQTYSYSWDLTENGVYNDAYGASVDFDKEEPGIYQISVKATRGNEQITAHKFIYIEPKPEEIISVKKEGTEFIFELRATESEMWDEVYYFVDFDDGTYSEVIGPYASNEIVELKHSFLDGTYNVKYRAMYFDKETGTYKETGWSNPHQLSASTSFNSFFLRFFNTFIKRTGQNTPTNIELITEKLLSLN
jgi:hypothetical protein